MLYLSKACRRCVWQKYLLFCLALMVCHPLLADALLQKLQEPNTHLLFRHALAPGTGDPAGFDVNDCATQRNLSQAGRAQAASIGDYLKRNQVTVDAIMSSQWCRCLDTASLISLQLYNSDKTQALTELNSVWTETQAIAEARSSALINYLDKLPEDKTLLMVTHYINILNLTGETTGSGEGIVIQVKNNNVEVLGQLSIP